jgi:hypothetical protein
MHAVEHIAEKCGHNVLLPDAACQQLLRGLEMEGSPMFENVTKFPLDSDSG